MLLEQEESIEHVTFDMDEHYVFQSVYILFKINIP